MAVRECINKSLTIAVCCMVEKLDFDVLETSIESTHQIIPDALFCADQWTLEVGKVYHVLYLRIHSSTWIPF
jgi:hypothetical protein